MSVAGTHFRADVQGLRAIAVGLVIAGHLATYQIGGSWFSGGFIGVDVFFVLSGFLITSLMLREADRTGRISLGGFYARRARRILPAATVALVITVLVCAAIAPVVRVNAATQDARWSALFLANWHFSHIGTSYFDNTATSPFQHFWSLAVEEQFYLLWPLLLILVVGRVRRRTLAMLVGLACLASLAWAIHVGMSPDTADRAAAYFSTPARAYELGIGVLLAIVGVPALSPRTRTALGTVGLLTLAIAAMTLNEHSVFPGWRALIPALATAALLAAGSGTATPVTRLLSVPPLRFLGDISYSLYLWHFPIIILAPFYLRSVTSISLRAAVEVVLMLAFAAASYYAVERQFLGRGVIAGWLRERRALALWPIALLVILAGTAEASGYSQHQQEQQVADAKAWWSKHPQVRLTVAPTSAPAASPQAVTDELSQAISIARQGAPLPPGIRPAHLRDDVWQRNDRYLCDPDPRRASTCTLGDPRASRTIAVVGDSHAAMWLPALDAIGHREHIKIVRYVMVGCGPYRVVQASAHLDQPTCDAFRDWTLDQLATLHPDTVILGARGYLFVKQHSTDTVESQWRRGVTETVTAIRPLTKQVILLGDDPARIDPLDCLTDPDGTELSCMNVPRGPEIKSNSVTKEVGEAAGGRYVDILPLVCAADACPLLVGDDIVYQDGSHLTITWVKHLTRAFEDLLQPLITGPKQSNRRSLATASDG